MLRSLFFIEKREEGKRMKRRIALVLTLVMFVTSISVPSVTYAMPQKEADVWDEEIETEGQTKVPSKYLTFGQEIPEVEEKAEESISIDRDTVSADDVATDSDVEIKEGEKVTLDIEDTNMGTLSFSPAESGYYMLQVESAWPNWTICNYSSCDKNTGTMTDGGSINSFYYMKDEYDEGSCNYAHYFEKDWKYQIQLSNSDTEELTVTLSRAEDVSVEDADAASFSISAEQKFVHLKTNFAEKTLFEIADDTDVYIAKAGNALQQMSSWITLDAGEREYVIYNPGNDLRFIKKEVKASENKMTLHLSSEKTWVKFTPDQTGYYSMYMPDDDVIEVENYREEDQTLYGMDVKRWTNGEYSVYSMYMTAETNYFFSFYACEDRKVEITLQPTAKGDQLQEGENKLSISQNCIYDNPFAEEGIYYLKVKDGENIRLVWHIKNKYAKKLTVTDKGTYVRIRGKALQKRSPYIEAIANLSEERSDVTLEIRKVSCDNVTLSLGIPHTQEVAGNAQTYSFTAPEEGRYLYRIRTKKPWNSELIELSGYEAYHEQELENGQYEYTARYYMRQGEDISLDVLQDQSYTITMEKYKESPVLDYDRYMAFIASGGTISVSAEWDDEWDPLRGEIYSDSTHIYHIDATEFKNKNDAWLLSDAGYNVSWMDKDDWYGRYDQECVEFQEGDKVADRIAALNSGKRFYKITDVYTLTDNNLTTKTPKKKNMTDTFVDSDAIILVKSVPETVYVQKITLNGATALTVGQKTTMTAAIDTLNKYTATNAKVEFSSSDSSVLKVSANGAVEAVKAGKADVICKSADGNAMQKMTVTVKAAAVKPSPAPTETPKPSQAPVVQPEKKGTVVQAEKGTGKYKVTDANSESPSVEYAGQTKAEKKKKTVTIPATVTSNGVKYEVTSVAPKSFKNNKKVTTVKMPATIEKIGRSAFEGCKKLKTVAIGKSTKSIGKNAFKNCKNLKTVTIKSTKVPKIDKSAFKGVNKKCVIKVPKKLVKKYKQLFKKKGIKLKVKAI